MSRFAKSDSFHSIFDGYSPAVIAAWCLVSPKTARDWITGRKQPSRRAVRLFQLHAQRRVLGSSWTGWTVKGDTLFTPAGKPFHRADMDVHEIIYQIASYCRRHHTYGEEIWDTIIRLRN